ncbi:unnamed protein product [Pleuronectes platessa]|uniref:Uncharacterized protein n=1 Tax=Pleuronectes platessa TaxID=8262 RepID=A0A9N7ZBM4_PLEPL|nr:unnamed protein product [Pleuronectes platessa]
MEYFVLASANAMRACPAFERHCEAPQGGRIYLLGKDAGARVELNNAAPSGHMVNSPSRFYRGGGILGATLIQLTDEDETWWFPLAPIRTADYGKNESPAAASLSEALHHLFLPPFTTLTSAQPFVDEQKSMKNGTGGAITCLPQKERTVETFLSNAPSPSPLFTTSYRNLGPTQKRGRRELAHHTLGARITPAPARASPLFNVTPMLDPGLQLPVGGITHPSCFSGQVLIQTTMTLHRTRLPGPERHAHTSAQHALKRTCAHEYLATNSHCKVPSGHHPRSKRNEPPALKSSSS